MLSRKLHVWHKLQCRGQPQSPHYCNVALFVFIVFGPVIGQIRPSLPSHWLILSKPLYIQLLHFLFANDGKQFQPKGFRKIFGMYMSDRHLTRKRWLSWFNLTKTAFMRSSLLGIEIINIDNCLYSFIQLWKSNQ